MNINQNVSLNLTMDGIPPRLHMVQGDSNSRTIVASLWDDSQPYNVPASAVVMMRFRKPDGTGGLYDVTEGGAKISVSGNVVTIPVATQLLTVAGVVFAQVDVYGAATGATAEKLATFRLAIEVAPSVYPDANIISSDYYNILTAKVAEAVAAADRAEQATVYTPTIGSNGNWYVWDQAAGKYVDSGVSAQPGQVQIATAEVAGIVKPNADFDIAEDGTLSLYKAIAVNSLTLNKDSVYEIGAAVTGLDAVWVLNKTPAEQTITVPEDTVIIENIGANVRSTTELTGSAATQWNGIKTQEKTSGTLTVVLTVKDDRGAAASKTASIQWLNGVYTGAAAVLSFRAMTKSLQSDRVKTFTVNAGAGEYIWYACPGRYGTPSFNVGGFDGGFSKVGTLNYTNPSGYTENYQVWRSDNAGLGTTTVKVS